MVNQLSILENQLGKLPKTAAITLNLKTNSKNCFECYQENLYSALTINDKKIERYSAMSRVIFSLLASFIEESKKNKTKKIFCVLLKKDPFKNFKIELFEKSFSILEHTKANKSKKVKINRLKIYHNFLEELINQYPKYKIPISTSRNHFIKKIENEIHPLMSEYVLDFGEDVFKKNFNIVNPLILTIEKIIHGIDDYVDNPNKNYKNHDLDLLNVIVGALILFDYTIKIDLKNTYFFLIKKRPLKFINFLKDCLIDLTQVPFVEDATITKILNSKNIENEINHALLNLETRTKGTKKAMLSPTYIYLNKDLDILELEELILINRMQQMFSKDIKDIKTDLKNEDYKGAAVIYKKYIKNKQAIKLRLKLIADFQLSKAFTILYKPNKYFEAKEKLAIRILKQNEKLNKLIKAL